LHGTGIEIVSPRFLNLRELAGDRMFIPERASTATGIQANRIAPEDIVFDKAEQAENIERMRERLAALNKSIQELDGKIETAETPQQKESLQNDRQRMASQLERLDQLIRRADESRRDN
ncbi:MAG TPA: hypothetical protein VF117_01140, partial [Gammaproteobacteria bacterium]